MDVRAVRVYGTYMTQTPTPENLTALLVSIATDAAPKPDATRCPICHARDGHSLSCPTRWYS